MALLSASDYNEAYFNDGHPAGYTKYSRWYRYSTDILTDTTGEFFADIAKYYRTLAFLDGKKVLEIGCANGFIIQWLREQGIDANGLDVCAWCKTQADAIIAPYITTGDARTALASMGRNAYNVLFSKDTLCCFSDAELIAMITQMNRVGFLQIHMVRDDYNTTYYNNHTIDWYLAQGFKKGTIFVKNNDFVNYYTK